MIDFVDDSWRCGAIHTYPVQMQENQLFNLQEHFERYSIVFPVFGFNSSKKGINLTKSYLLTILVNERAIELTVKQTAKQYVSLKLGDFLFFFWNKKRTRLCIESRLFFSKVKRQTRQKSFSFKNGLIVKRNWTAKIFLCMTHSLAFCGRATTLKKTMTTVKTLIDNVYLQNKH